MNRKVLDSYPDFKDLRIEMLQDPKFAKSYLKLSLDEYAEDRDDNALLQSIMDVEEAQGGFFGFQRLVNKHFSKPAKGKARARKGVNGGEARV